MDRSRSLRLANQHVIETTSQASDAAANAPARRCDYINDQNTAANANIPTSPKRCTGGVERGGLLPAPFADEPGLPLAADLMFFDERGAGAEVEWAPRSRRGQAAGLTVRRVC